MQLRRLSLALTGALAMAVILVAIGLPGLPNADSSNPSTGPQVLSVWEEANFQGDLLGGLNHSVVIPITPLPANDPTVYVSGTFNMVSWTYLHDGLFNRSGVCANSFSPFGACGVYVAIWTPTSWNAYAHGGPMTPIWCAPGDTPGCVNTSLGELGTPNLSQYDGSALQIVVWNLEPFQLSGSYQFVVYSSTPPS